jgi:putative flavoprotein involved in K+ transport
LRGKQPNAANPGDAAALERRRVAADWLAAFGAALDQRDYDRIAGMIHPDGWWRDLLTFNWEFTPLHGPAEIKAWLAHTFESNPAQDFRLDGEPVTGTLGEYNPTLEFFFRFSTPIATGRGYVRLVGNLTSTDTAKVLTILTSMRALKGFPEAAGHDRPREGNARASQDRFRDRDPDVIVIGGGQSGLMMAARLRALDISTLVVDKSERVGDVWRKRYRSLKLHNEICMNHFPYLSFPETWPKYLPKDKVADWLEFYSDSMDLDLWTRTEFLNGTYDDVARRWTARLRLADGSVRTMRPRHVVMALGVSGIPNIPRLDGLDHFAGEVLHSSGPVDDVDVSGKSVLVVGVGTSAHDVAHDMHRRGGRVTMLQRSPIIVVSLEPSSVRPYELYRRNDGIKPLADTDLMVQSVPYDLLRRLHQPMSYLSMEDDKALLDGLRKTGFLLDNGEDDAGYFIKLLRYQAGYYINVGASEMIIEGKIKLKPGVAIERLTANTVMFSDGTSLDIDVLVLGTGYLPLQEGVRALFGDDVAKRVGPIWGIGADGELQAMYARTGQDNFYVTGGGFMGARVYSHYTALLIKADLEGLLPPRPSSKAKSKSPVANRNAERLENARV